MKFGPIDHPMTGVAVPVSALRSRLSCGVGEYPDLAALGAWAAGVGLEVIQLLPVNDTGSNSSPYSALSAFALHPLYVRLEDVRGAERYAAEIAAWRRKAEARPRLDYPGTLAFKLSVLERIHRDRAAEIAADAGFAAWLADNPWVRPYAAFRALERANGGAAWETWGDCRGRPGGRRPRLLGRARPRSAGSTRGCSARPPPSSPPPPGRSSAPGCA